MLRRLGLGEASEGISVGFAFSEADFPEKVAARAGSEGDSRGAAEMKTAVLWREEVKAAV